MTEQERRKGGGVCKEEVMGRGVRGKRAEQERRGEVLWRAVRVGCKGKGSREEKWRREQENRGEGQ